MPARRMPRTRRWAAASAALGLGLAAWAVGGPPASAATVATFTPATGLLSVFGDNLDSAVSISRTATGAILVNEGAIAVSGGTPTAANTQLIQVFGLGGSDVVRLDETFGALPRATLFGGTGNDTLTGGSSADQLFGQAGLDTLLGRGGVDVLFGGTEDDALTGGDADDQVFGEAGQDRMIWTPGDDTDLNEGGPDADTVEVVGGAGAEAFTAQANGSRVRFDRVNPAPFSIDVGSTERLLLLAGGGNDSFSASGNLAALIAITADGGAGDDTLLGGNGVDTLIGADGDDVVDGQQGNDLAFLGAGADVFRWDSGDGNDVVEGQAGADRMTFSGSNLSERINLRPEGGRVRFSRDVAAVDMDLNDVEVVDVAAFRGADAVTVRDLSGTDLTDLTVDLAADSGGTPTDGAADTVRVEGGGGDEVVQVESAADGQEVNGLATRVRVLHADPPQLDRLIVDAGAGEDVVFAATLRAPAAIEAEGGVGNDLLVGGDGTDTLLGEDGNDVLIGRGGTDPLDGGPGTDVVRQGNG